MKKVMNYFPVLDDELMDKVFPTVSYNFSYEKNKNGEIEEISFDDSIGNNITLNTKNNDWNHEEYDLTVKSTINVENASRLYGANGIAPKESKIGIGIEYYSQKSKTRDVAIFNEPIDDDEENWEFSIDHCICKNSFISDVDINIFIYLKQSADLVEQDSTHLNNDEGIILGTLDHRRLYLVGTGSLFPIFVESIDDDRLWIFDIEYEDPEVDKFSDCSKLILNINHNDYKLIDPKNKSYCERVILEIISSSLFMVFTKLKEEKYLEDIKSSYEDGSIMSLISYYKDTLNVNFSSVKTIFDSLQYYSNKEYKNAIQN